MLAAEEANLPRFAGQKSFFERWAFGVQSESGEAALIVRASLAAREGRPEAEIWAGFFHRHDPGQNLAVVQRAPIGEVDLERFRLVVDGFELSQTGSRGAIGDGAGSIEWDLGWAAEDRPVASFPPASISVGRPVGEARPERLKPTSLVAELLARSAYVQLEPHGDLRATGTFVARGGAFAAGGTPGLQTHDFGPRPPARWISCHANSFKESPSAVFSATTLELPLGPLRSPPLTRFFVHYRGVDYAFDRPRQLVVENESRLQGESSPSTHYPIGRWIVGGGDARLRFRGEIWSRDQHFLGNEIRAPDGRRLFLASTRLAELHLEILTPDGAGFRRVDSLSTKSAQLEFGGREPDPRVRFWR